MRARGTDAPRPLSAMRDLIRASHGRPEHAESHGSPAASPVTRKRGTNAPPSRRGGTDTPRSAGARGTDVPRGATASPAGRRGQSKRERMRRCCLSSALGAFSGGTDTPRNRYAATPPGGPRNRCATPSFRHARTRSAHPSGDPSAAEAVDPGSSPGGDDEREQMRHPQMRHPLGGRNGYAAVGRGKKEQICRALSPGLSGRPHARRKEGTNTPLLHPRRQRRHPVGFVRRLVPADAADAGEAEREA